MLGVCERLGKSLDLDPLLFQVFFILWSFNSLGTALIVYFLLNIIL